MNERQILQVYETLSNEEQELRRKFFNEDEREFGSALREIEEQYGPMIKNVWRKIGIGDPDLQDDLMQDLMLTLVQKRATFRGESKLTTWIIHIAKNLALKAFQSKKYRPWRQVIMMEDGSTIDHPSEDPKHLPIEIHEILSVLIENLADEYRAVIPLLMEGKSYAEMASILDVPVGTIRSRVFAIHQKIDKIANQLEKPKTAKRQSRPSHITSSVA